MRGGWDKFREVNSEAGGGGESCFCLFGVFSPTIFPSVTVHSLQYKGNLRAKRLVSIFALD